MTVRRAQPEDFPAIRQLLKEAQLPADDVQFDLGPFVVGEVDGTIVGSAGIELLGPVGVLRSVAVTPRHQRCGIAVWLCSAAIECSRRHRLRELFLLTNTAADFFTKLGFARVARDAAPAAVRGTREFRELCPASAVVMQRSLHDPSGQEMVDGLTRAYQDFLRGEPSALLALLDAGAVYHLPGKHMGGGQLRGRSAIVQRLAEAAPLYDQPPLVTVLDAIGDSSVVVTAERLSARRNGCVLEQRVWVVWRFEQSKCVELWAHFEDQRACDRFWAQAEDQRVTTGGAGEER